ncbi:MAG: DUF2214 family protein [Hyphomonadaceae bacterium]|nr:DUF2214 family protein [Hyphomonadaceae bacterium]
MLLDVVFAFLHFVFLLIMVGALVAEAFVLRLPPSAASLRLLARADAFYGGSAGLLIAAGLGRVFWGAKGPDYYWAEPFFWAKMAGFLVIGLLSIPPTLRFLAWRRALAKDASFVPPPEQLKAAKRYVMIELHILPLLILFAVLMARGVRF